MSINEKDWIEEQQRVHGVTGKIQKRIEQVEKEVGKAKTEVIHIRKHFWDDVSVNLSNSDDLTETYFSMKQQVDVLSERERRHRYSSSELIKLMKLAQSPYFGRIDFQEDGAKDVEHIYLGIASFLDEDEDTFLIYDWRAPISSLYYDYPPGKVIYQTPVGEITGTMPLKRQFVIHNGQIQLMFDTGVTIGDQLLQKVLSRTSDAQMKSIVATIQKEQNQIIRNDRSRMLIVQGAAGSGKTSAALQRVAYLLYKHRETLQADQMVLFSPNPLFNSYVSTVLPELGEENMQQTTFQEYLEHRLCSEFELEDPFTQIEYVLTEVDNPGYEARLSGIRYKSSADFLKLIYSYKDTLEKEGMIFEPLTFRDKQIITAEQIKDRFYEIDSSIHLLNRIMKLRDWLLKELLVFEETERQQPWVEEEANLLDNEDYHRAYKRLRREQKGRGVTFDDYGKEEEILSRMVIENYSKPLRQRIKQLHFIDVSALYRQIFANQDVLQRLAGNEIPSLWPQICLQTIEKLDRSELSYEDATPYLYLRELVQGFETNNSIRYVMIDEAQDYSPFQLEFLNRLFPRARMTALGDLNQAIFAHSSAFTSVDPIIDLYGPDQTEMIRLTRSYRSTREIVEFTRGMVPNGDMIEPFNRNGEKPRICIVENKEILRDKIVNDIKALQADGYESIGVICKTASESVGAFERLKDLQVKSLITKQTISFEKGVLVIPAYLAKGVEFDAVIIFNGSKDQYGRENERKLFYTACTRAMHLLHIYSVGEPSTFITAQKPGTYELTPS